MSDEYAIPPLRDLPGDRLAERKRHLVAEIAHPSARRRIPTRAVVVLAATALVVALGTASAFAVRNVILGASSEWAGSPTWSPDGRRIAYIVSRSGRDDLYVMNADGSAQRRVRRNARGPAWSPDGRKLAFVRQYPVHCGSHICVGSDVYVVNAGGGRLRKLPHTAGAAGPVWLPDGRLAIVKGKDCWRCSPKNALWVMNADGSGRRLVASGFLGRIDWSPDGRSIAFEYSDRPHFPRIYVMAADGSGRRWLADGTRPLWSPRGEVIAFRPDLRPDPSNELRRINADGSGERTLTTGIYAINGAEGYAWSPDGRRIVFTTLIGNSNTEIYVMNADGSEQRNLTRHRGADDSAAWSPDGQKIAFASDRSGGGIFVMNADGSGLRRLTS